LTPFGPSAQYPKKKLPDRFRSVSPMLWELVRPRLGRLLLGLLLVLVGRAAGLVLPASTRYLVDQVIVKRQTGLLGPLMLGVLFATLVQGACSLALTQVISKEGHRLVAELRRKVQAHVLRLPVAWFDSAKAGTLATRIIGDVEGTRQLMGFPLVEFVGGLVTAFLSLLYLLSISVTLTAAAVVAALIFSLLSKGNFKRLRPVFRDAAMAQSEVAGRLTATLSGIRVVKGYHAEAREERVFSDGTERMKAIAFRMSDRGSFMLVSTTLVLGTVSAGVMYLAARQIFAGSLTLGGFMTFTAFLTYLMGPMIQLSAIGTQLTEALAGLDRTQELLRETPEDQNVRRALSIGLVKGLVKFDQVSFAYQDGKPVLHEVTFEAEPGTVTALVGSSGSGKSTITGLIAAFYDPSAGTIWVDGTDLTTVRLDSFRSQLGVVLQDTFLFDGSIRDNVAFARPDASDEEIKSACVAAHVEEFATRLSKGYETVVGERGVKLSGGQRQRISIARAILANPRILILDEATSSLDSESEAAIQKGLAFLMEGRTTFVIAHRLSTIHRAHQILVVEEGKIVERGTHETLYASGGRYFALSTRQQSSTAIVADR
jgi:ABC-type multidrug transport system fused ATPase/permease subunit